VKRLLQQEQNPGEKVLQDILKSKTNGHGADSERFNQIAGLERRSENGECDQETQNQGCWSEPVEPSAKRFPDLCAVVVRNAARETRRLPQVAETQGK